MSKSAPDTEQLDWDSILDATGETHLRDSLLDSLSKHNALPFLFIGSGMSRRYLDLPDWIGILRKFSDEIDRNVDYYVATSNGDLPRAASLLAKDYHNAWFNREDFQQRREANQGVIHDDEAALKLAMAQFVQNSSDLSEGTPGVAEHALRLEIERLSQAVIDGVITTNYDNLPEQIFKDFETYIGQDELLLSNAQFIAEIYKIHGSCSQYESIVATERDYENFTERNSYLAAKLLTIFAEHPVIFLGYSLSDKYIREIINSISRAVGPNNLKALEKRIYFVEWDDAPTSRSSISQYFMEVSAGQALPITRVATNSFLPIFDSLARLARPFPAKVLRELRKHVFDLVTQQDSEHGRDTLHVAPIDSDDADGLRVVFGVGNFSEEQTSLISDVGFRALTREDLARDVLGVRERDLDANNVLRLTLPELTRNAPSSYLPIWKYIHSDPSLTSKSQLDLSGLDFSVQTLAERVPVPSDQNKRRFDGQHRSTLTTPRDIFDADLALYYKFEALLCLEPDLFELSELRVVLIEQLENPDNEKQNNRSSLFKAIAYYDRLKWGPRDNREDTL